MSVLIVFCVVDCQKKYIQMVSVVPYKNKYIEGTPRVSDSQKMGSDMHACAETNIVMIKFYFNT